MNDLLMLDTELFLEACEVQEFEGDAAQKAVADALAGDDLVLEQAS
jgi:hypothetical protein